MVKLVSTHMLICFLFLASFICQVSAAASPAHQKSIIIYGLDETGSFDFRNRAISLAGQLINKLQPDDVFYARRITGSSYLDECAVFRLQAPQGCQKPSNKFNRKASIRFHRCLKTSRRVKVQAMRLLAGMEPKKAKHTDVWGFIAAAAERFKFDKSSNAKRLLIIASDMRDTVGRKITPDLSGVEVKVVVWQVADDPKYAARLKRAWKKALLKHCKAKSVEFIPPDIKFSLN